MQKLRNPAGLETTKNSENVAVAAGVLNQNRNVIIEPLAGDSAGGSFCGSCLPDRLRQPSSSCTAVTESARSGGDHHSGRSCILPAVYEKGNGKSILWLEKASIDLSYI